MIVGIPKETFPGERRVAAVPATVSALGKSKLEVVIESGAGADAGYPDQAFKDKGARVAGSRADVFQQADIVCQVRAYGANPERGRADLDLLKSGQLVIGACEPLTAHRQMEEIAAKGVSLCALELMPRITRAQSMDILSSMATIAGYKAVLMAADQLPKMFPMMMTAAGTIAPARVFVVGVGVAGLQAIATAKKLGAVVSAYDIRPEVKDQVKSVGAKFVELDLDTSDAQDAGGYAKDLGEEFIRKQREMMTTVVAESDVVITTAAVPGKKAPTLVTADMARGMAPGSVLIDLAAERGGNCELTKPGEINDVGGVKIVGPENVPATVPFHASQMFAKNVQTFLQHLIDKEGKLQLNLDDEITKGVLVTHQGKVVNETVLAAMGKSPAAAGAGHEG